MAIKIPAAFFAAKEMVFIGYSSRHREFCTMAAQAFTDHGTKVYPVNPNQGDYGVEVFSSIETVPAQPELAYVLTNRRHNDGLAARLAAKGVKRVLFNSRQSTDEGLSAECRSLGMTVAVSCPMMALGKGLHRFHGWLAGVERA